MNTPKNNLPALLSIIILMAVFIAVCAAVLALVFLSGLVPMPDILRSTETTEAPSETTVFPSFDLDLSKLLEPVPDTPTLTSPEVTDAMMIEILRQTPFVKSYHIDAQISFLSQDRSETQYIGIFYDNTSSERFRVLTMRQGTLAEVIICDGTFVEITDYLTGESRMFEKTSDVDIASLCGLPYFGRLFTDPHYSIDSIRVTENEYIITCVYDNTSVRDVFNVSTGTGLIISSKSYDGDECIFTSEITYYSDEVTDDGEIFKVSGTEQ